MAVCKGLFVLGDKLMTVDGHACAELKDPDAERLRDPSPVMVAEEMLKVSPLLPPPELTSKGMSELPLCTLLDRCQLRALDE